jgi:hypothetical protein
MKNKNWFSLCFFLLAVYFSVNAQTGWPKEIPFKNGGKVTIYQPQLEKFEGNKLWGHAAVSVNETVKSEAVYGAIFFTSYMSTDKNSRTAYLDSIDINNVKFSGVENKEKEDLFIAFLESEIPKWNMEIALDAIVATIRRDYPNAEIYNNDPPKIIYATRPASLVILDGEPKIKKDKDLDAERVLNTPTLIFKEGSQWNMYVGGNWYKSNSVTSGWTVEKSMSKKVSSINDQIKKQEKENNDGKASTEKPEVTDIVVSTEPAEVIQSKGEAVYKNIEGTNLSYVSNSPNNIIKDNATGTIYILIAGRWFKSASFNGPWTFNEPDKLPADFSNIPEGSEKDNVLASVAGTDAAEEAMIDAEIPQTAKVDRKTATVTVEYDGSPKFEPVKGTSLFLAENSNITILKEASGNFFALDNGVWFTGPTANGPWSVATVRPADVENIPMQSAAYGAKFVHIYQVTPEYTIQGYTAGYLGSYIQGDPVIVFGTGFHYNPWYGSLYYPRPVTWGFGFSYNPWYGWSMNFGFMHIGFGGPVYGFGGGWYGPPMYRPPYYRPPYGGGGYYGHGGGNHYGNNNININTGGNNININSNNNNNLYKNKKGVTTKTNTRDAAISDRTKNNNTKPGGANNNSRPGVGSGNKPTAKPVQKDNNVFADRDGNVYNRDKDGNINQRDNKSNDWKPTGNKELPPSRPTAPTTKPAQKPTTQPAQRPTTQPAQRPATKPAPAGSINRDMQMRDRSSDRSNNYNQSRNRAPAQRPAPRPAPGGARGGGVRKR